MATKRMSQSGRPLLHQVLPLIDVLERMLLAKANDSSLHTSVRVAAMHGVSVLRKYYSKTDDSILYRISHRAYIFRLLQPH